LDNGPEDGHRGADDSEVDLETGEDDEERGPPGKVEIGQCCASCGDDAFKAPDGCCDDTEEKLLAFL
jgi:hypothetical protein